MWQRKSKRLVKRPLKKRSLAKRWFASASGWGLSLNLGTGDPKNNIKQKRCKLPDRSKIVISSGTVAAANFLHNTIYTAGVSPIPTQGTADGNRLGDFIKIVRISLRAQLNTGTATTPGAGVKVRCLIIAAAKQSAAANFTAGFGAADLFYNGASAPLSVARPNEKLVHVLCDEYLSCQPGAVSGSVESVHVDCPINADFEYQTGLTYGTAVNYYIIAIPYVTGGITGTSLCGDFGYDWAMAFLDG